MCMSGVASVCGFVCVCGMSDYDEAQENATEIHDQPGTILLHK